MSVEEKVFGVSAGIGRCEADMDGLANVISIVMNPYPQAIMYEDRNNDPESEGCWKVDRCDVYLEECPVKYLPIQGGPRQNIFPD
jgi:hypothetical protein